MPSLIVRPQVALVDDDVSIRVEDLRPRQPAIVRARTIDHAGRNWSGEVPIEADAAGRADIDGFLTIVRSMRAGDGGGPFVLRGTATLVFSVEVLTDGAVFGDAVEVHRVLRDVGVSLTPIRRTGFVGSLYLPPGPGPHPGVVVVGGLEGGAPDAAAALLASRGFAAVAVGLFGADGLPPTPELAPVDPVEGALDLLSGHLGVAAGPHAVVGWSIGATVALLAAATWPDRVGAAVSISGSPVVFTAPVAAGHGVARPPWTYRGFVVPFARPGDGEDARAAATIPLERVTAAVLLVSGGADRVWPSTELGLVAERRLANTGRKVVHLRRPAAGHGIRFPHLPTHDVDGDIAFGGTPDADADAAASLWPDVLRFLRDRSP